MNSSKQIISNYHVELIFVDKTMKTLNINAVDIYRAYEKAMEIARKYSKGVNDYIIKKKPG